MAKTNKTTKKTQVASEENFSESITEFSKAIRDKLQTEIQVATNKLRTSKKGRNSKKDFSTTFKEFVQALKAKTVVEIDRATEKIRKGMEKEERKATKK